MLNPWQWEFNIETSHSECGVVVRDLSDSRQLWLCERELKVFPRSIRLRCVDKGNDYEPKVQSGCVLLGTTTGHLTEEWGTDWPRDQTDYSLLILLVSGSRLL